MLCILQNTPYHSSIYNPILRGVSFAPHFDIHTFAKSILLMEGSTKLHVLSDAVSNDAWCTESFTLCLLVGKQFLVQVLETERYRHS
jgi:hypothetical protein